MPKSIQKTTYLADYQAPAYFIPTIDLHFHLKPQATIVTSELTVVKNSSNFDPNTIILHGNQLDIIAIKLNGELLTNQQYEYDGKELRINTNETNLTLETKVKISPKTNFSLEGLYLSNEIYCSHCEPESFRNITFFIDRPDVLSKFTTTIQASLTHCPILLCNGNLIEKGVIDNEHWATFEDPFLKPSYLFALVAGDLASIEDEFITKSGRRVKLKVFAAIKHIDQCKFAINALKRAMCWDEIHYGREYDLDQYYIVAIEDFNSGAMENKGLNIFNTACLLADPLRATDKDFMRVESVVAHEYFHNWSGNRVTCRDWFQLSLKEGFTVFREQQFSGTLHSDTLQRIDDVDLLMSVQFSEDAGPLAHAVRPDKYQEIANFYTTTIYEKGAEVIRMLFSLLGEDKFRTGTDLYFERHDGEAVTTDDFVQAIAAANQIDLTLFKQWYTQIGTPTVTIDDHYDELAKTYTLTFHQHTPLSSKQTKNSPLMIPIKMGLIDGHGNDIKLTNAQHKNFHQETSSFLLTDTTDTLTLKSLTEKPTPSFFREFSAPIKLQFPYSNNQLIHLLKHDTDEFNQWYASRRIIFKAFVDANDDADKESIIPDDFFAAYQELLESILLGKKSIDVGLMARLLTLPSQRQIYEQFTLINVEAVEKNRLEIKKSFAKHLTPFLLKIYDKFVTNEPYTFNRDAMASRAIKNACLALLGETDIAKKLVENQFSLADNMTDRSAALNICVNFEDKSLRQKLLTEFYITGKDDPLVIDEWFSCQARSEHSTVFDDIKMLQSHADFNLKNPNRVRALIGVFANQNLANFHHKDGKCYELLANIIIEIDQFNPKIAARLVSPLSQWPKFDENRQAKIRENLLRVQNTSGLSADTKEMTGKSLKE